eukprot:TRINITY_DN93830_c0_g1_i1.p1 TRINITY_DN93830_c0_g1~~TRINITY_DN93830_c0_g1_i1.p1  ORF type:complete len:389 (+),score=91.84 TRINITY_DN93830_c0_g1_i1:64-1230(+)
MARSWSLLATVVCISVSLEAAAEDVSADEQQHCSATGGCPAAGADFQVLHDIVADGSNNTTGKRPREIEAPFSRNSRIALVLGMFSIVGMWLAMIIKFTCDGTLPARMALWGLLPEVCAAVSVKSLVGLLRLKRDPTPAIVLRNCVSDDGAVQLAEGIRKYQKTAQVEALELPYNPGMGLQGVRALAALALEEGTKLEELDISYNPQLGDAAVSALRPLLEDKASKLNILKLGACNITVAGLKELSQAAEKWKVRTLDLSRNDLRGAGELLGTLCEAPLLQELMLSGCNLSLDDVREVAENLAYTSITSLQLAGNGLGNEGLKVLCEHLPKSQIDELGLEGNDIEYEALSVLGTAWAKRPFSRVSLRGNLIRPEQLQDFIKTLKSMHA